MFFDEVFVFGYAFDGCVECWVGVGTHFHVFPESPVADGLFDAADFGCADVEIVFSEEKLPFLVG